MTKIVTLIALGYFSLIIIVGVILLINEELIKYPSKYRRIFTYFNFITNYFSTSFSIYYIRLYQLNCIILIASGIFAFFTVLIPTISYKLSLYSFAFGLFTFWLTIDSPFVYKNIINIHYLGKFLYSFSEIVIYIGFRELIIKTTLKETVPQKKEKKSYRD